MRKLVVLSFITLDGIMQAPGGPEEDPSGGFVHGGWSVGYWDDVLSRVMGAQMAPPFDLLLGRRTYEIFAAHWPFVKNDPMGDKLSAARKYVISNTIKNPSWANSIVLSGDIVPQIRQLKDQDGPQLQVHGSGNLIQALLAHDLIDDLRLKIFPIVLGVGKRLFADGTIPAEFRCTGCETSTTGVIIADYERAGQIKTGSFALDTPTEAELSRRKRLQEEE